jgi:hypothetical protein
MPEDEVVGDAVVVNLPTTMIRKRQFRFSRILEVCSVGLHSTEQISRETGFGYHQLRRDLKVLVERGNLLEIQDYGPSGQQLFKYRKRPQGVVPKFLSIKDYEHKDIAALCERWFELDCRSPWQDAADTLVPIMIEMLRLIVVASEQTNLDPDVVRSVERLKAKATSIQVDLDNASNYLSQIINSPNLTEQGLTEFHGQEVKKYRVLELVAQYKNRFRN